MDSSVIVCSCGNNIDSPLMTIKTRYSKFGWLLLSLAISSKPKEIIYQCQKCGEVIKRSTDPLLLDKYRYNSDVTK